MTISIIAAMDNNKIIGNKNSLPWYIPSDLKYFKRVTMGSTVVMGRKTYQSMGKALPKRKNIVLSKDPNLKLDDAIVYNSFNKLLSELNKNNDEEHFIIGGSEIYKVFLPYANKLYITHVIHEFKGDTYFPDYDEDNFELASAIYAPKNQNSPYDLMFLTFKNKL